VVGARREFGWPWLRNHGSSPAFVTRWVRRWDFASGPPEPLAPETGDGVSWCIFPGWTGEALEPDVLQVGPDLFA